MDHALVVIPLSLHRLLLLYRVAVAVVLLRFDVTVETNVHATFRFIPFRGVLNLII